MLKKWLVVLGGVILASSIPLGALALTSSETAEPSPPASAATDAPETGDSVDSPASVQNQQMVRQQLRVHAETGPPDDFEPVRQRLQEQARAGTGDTPATSMGKQEQRNNECTGECTHDEEPTERGAARGAGSGGQRRQGNG